MVSYAQMTDKEIEDYRQRSREAAKKREEEWKKKHPNGVNNCYTPFDNVYSLNIPHRIITNV